MNTTTVRIIRMMFLGMLLLTSSVLSAQTIDYLAKAREFLANGDCERARLAYEDYKKYVNPQGNAEVAQRIEECKQGVPPAATPTPDNKEFAVNGIAFNMIYVEGGTFTMGCTGEQGSDCSNDECPAHQVTLGSFYMGETEVTLGLWRAFISETGYRTDAEKEGWAYLFTRGGWNKTSGVYWIHDEKGNVRSISEDAYPVLYVSWNDASEFCKWLSKKTGETFRLPTEAQWEYAARGGNKSKAYRCAGSNWYDGYWNVYNSGRTIYPVGASMHANELGLYDMGGNVWEWCEDWYSRTFYSDNRNWIDPVNTKNGPGRVIRGGSSFDDASCCRVAYRYCYVPSIRYGNGGFRIVLLQLDKCSEKNTTPNITQLQIESNMGMANQNTNLTFKIKDNVTFNMVFVEGGTFTMGCTGEQDNECSDDERPAHQVTLSDFYIGETEVTQGLWRAVMGSEPSYKCNNWTREEWRGISYPAYGVSWDDCQELIKRLNELVKLPSGWHFALPTEAQWEFAARGGNKGKNHSYKYSGSNTWEDVAWFDRKSDEDTTYHRAHPVKRKQPNALGLYDMSGNVYEWCQDVYDKAYYEVSPLTDPQGPIVTSVGSCIVRGGCVDDFSWYGCVWVRVQYGPDDRDWYYGLRLALVHQ